MTSSDELANNDTSDRESKKPSASSAVEQDVSTDAPTKGRRTAFDVMMRTYKHTESLVPQQRQSPRLQTSSESPSSLVEATSRRDSTKRSSSFKPPNFSKRRKPSGYVGPEAYAHLSNLQDVLEPGLICVFVGVNPGIATATKGHAYAHPSNMFWKLLHSSGLTDRRCRPDEDGDLPHLYSMGNTNIVERPTKDQSELSKAEMVAGTAVLEEKFRKFKPEVICIVGKGIWEAIWRYKHGRAIKKEEFKYGWQHERENMGRDKTNKKGSYVFVATSTSGLAASLSPAQKEAIWQPLGEWVSKRRKERAEEAAANNPSSDSAPSSSKIQD